MQNFIKIALTNPKLGVIEFFLGQIGENAELRILKNQP